MYASVCDKHIDVINMFLSFPMKWSFDSILTSIGSGIS
jgi:hypothetical protein